MQRFAFILFSLLTFTVTKVTAQEVVQDSFDCGEQVRIEAQPLPGYRFVAWSDGDTNRVRTVDVDDNIELEAIFEPRCKVYQAPVDRIYDWLFMVNKDQLLSEGWLTPPVSEDCVRWYQIVEPIDDVGVHRDADVNEDILVSKGFTLAIGLNDDWQKYYAEVTVNADKAEASYMCTTIMRGFPAVRTDLPYTSTPLLPYTQKIFKDGMIYIQRNETFYTIDGQKLTTK